MLNKKYVEIGSRIKFLRKELGLTQLAFALKVGVAGKNNVANWEKGRSTPGHEQLFKICQMTNKTTDWILTGKTNQLQQKLDNIMEQLKILGIKDEKDFNKLFDDNQYMIFAKDAIEKAIKLHNK